MLPLFALFFNSPEPWLSSRPTWQWTSFLLLSEHLPTSFLHFAFWSCHPTSNIFSTNSKCHNPGLPLTRIMEESPPEVYAWKLRLPIWIHPKHWNVLKCRHWRISSHEYVHTLIEIQHGHRPVDPPFALTNNYNLHYSFITPFLSAPPPAFSFHHSSIHKRRVTVANWPTNLHLGMWEETEVPRRNSKS